MSRTWPLLRAIAETDSTFERAERNGRPVWIGKCIHCGTKLVLAASGEPLGPATVEHLLPRSAGGTDDLRNLAIACARCNHEKGVRHDRRAGAERAIEVRERLCEARLARWREPPAGAVDPDVLHVPLRLIDAVLGPDRIDEGADEIADLVRAHGSRTPRMAVVTDHPNPWYHALVVDLAPLAPELRATVAEHVRARFGER